MCVSGGGGVSYRDDKYYSRDIDNSTARDCCGGFKILLLLRRLSVIKYDIVTNAACYVTKQTAVRIEFISHIFQHPLAAKYLESGNPLQ